MVFKRNISLRTKIIGMILFVIGILGTSSFVSVNLLGNKFESTLSQTLTIASGNLNSKIAAQFYERYGDVQAFAVNPSVQNLDVANMPEVLDKYIDIYGIYDVILVVGLDGRYISSNTKDTKGQKLDISALKSKDYSGTRWFQAAINNNWTEDKGNGFTGTFFEDFISDKVYEVALAQKSWGSSFTTLIKDAAGNPVGIISNRTNKKWVETEIETMGYELRELDLVPSHITVTNADGKIIFNAKVANNGKEVEFDYGAETILKENFISSQNQVEKLVASGKPGFVESYYKGSSDADLVGYHPFESKKWISNIGWKTFVHTPSDIANKESDISLRNFLIGLLLSTVISILFAIWFGVSTSAHINVEIEKLSVKSKELADASSNISESATQLSGSATEQAAALQETVAAVDQISAMVEKNAEAANRSKEMSDQSRESAEKGRTTVENMLSAIEEIDHSNDEVSQQLSESNRQLSEITKLIVDIRSKTKVINDIVFQTKLLSFNASVEAARAGEYGKGFAVVAEEVGNLAQMSGGAAKEITTLLEESVRKVESIVRESKTKVERLMQSSKEKVRQGTSVAKECQDSLESILNNVQSVDSLVSEIAIASSEQSTGIREISKAVGQMEQVTQQNTTVANSSSIAGEKLKGQSEELSKIVNNMVLIVHGTGKSIGNARSAQEVKTAGNIINSSEVFTNAKNTYRDKNIYKKAAGAESVPPSDDPGFQEN